MKINNVNSINFKGLYIDKDISLPLLIIAGYRIHTKKDMDILFAKMDDCKTTKYTDVFVTNKADVYIKDRKQHKRIYSDKTKPLYHRFFVALSQATMMDKCYKNGENPYDYMD